jgi:hypothetical protein
MTRQEGRRRNGTDEFDAPTEVAVVTATFSWAMATPVAARPSAMRASKFGKTARS